MVRAFIAIDIGSNKMIASLLEELEKKSVRLKAVEMESMHITLKFLGDIDRKQLETVSKGMEVLEDFEAFSVSMEEVGAFPSVKRPRVIWIGIRDRGILKRVWGEIENAAESAGIERDDRVFSPHITLARIKDPKNSWKLRDFMEKHRNDSFGDIKVEEIKLKKSVLTPHGPIYSDIFTVKLKNNVV